MAINAARKEGRRAGRPTAAGGDRGEGQGWSSRRWKTTPTSGSGASVREGREEVGWVGPVQPVWAAGKEREGESWAGLEREGVRGKVLFCFFQI